MADTNFVLFQKDDQEADSHEDVWDDSALIQAYDRAVNLAKEKVTARLNLKDNSQTTSEEISNEEGSSSVGLSKSKNWKVGDYVRCVYSEDGIVYEAIIKQMGQSASSCLVKYLGYENEEEVKIEDLEPSAGPSARNQQIIAAGDASAASSDMECEAVSQSPIKPSSSGLEWQPVKPVSSSGSDWKFIKPEPLPSLPGQISHMSIPPPPPPAAWPPHGSSEMDSDSLYSMLMSWYMAGYHTGYYQGTQNRKKESRWKQ